MEKTNCDKSFVWFGSWTDQIDALPEKYQLFFYKAIQNYAMQGELPDFSVFAEESAMFCNAIWISIKSDIDRNTARRDAQIEAGKQSGIARRKKSLNSSQVVESENTTDTTVQINSEENESTFEKPTIKEVAEFCSTEKLKVDAKEFYDYYESRNWKSGKTLITDWRNTCRFWSNNARKTDFEYIQKNKEQISLADTTEFFFKKFPHLANI